MTNVIDLLDWSAIATIEATADRLTAAVDSVPPTPNASLMTDSVGTLLFDAWKESERAFAAYNVDYGIQVVAESYTALQAAVAEASKQVVARIARQGPMYVLIRSIHSKWTSAQLSRIRSFGMHPDGWHGSGSRAVSRDRVDAALRLCLEIETRFRIGEQRGPFFSPNEDGNVEFEWRIGDREIVSEIGESGFGVVALDSDTERFAGSVQHDGLIDWLAWLTGPAHAV